MNWPIIRMAFESWSRHRCARLGAALAYYSLFSVGPLLLIITSIAGLVFSAEAARATLMTYVQEQMGETGSQTVEALLRGASSQQTGLIASVAGAILLVVGAVGVVVQLKDALNTIWEVEPAKQSTWSFVFRSYLVSLIGILFLGLLLAASLVVSTALSAVSQWSSAEINPLLWQSINFAISSSLLTIVFGLLFRLFPDAEVEWKDVWPAAFATALLFQFGTFAISWYVGTQGFASIYGAAASIVVLLVWIYYSAQIVLFGAELSRAAKLRAQQHRNSHTR